MIARAAYLTERPTMCLTRNRMINWRRWSIAFAAAWIVCAQPTAAQSSQPAPPSFRGPFEVRQFLVLHMVNPEGRAFALQLRWREDTRAQMDCPILVRVFDPEEHLL